MSYYGMSEKEVMKEFCSDENGLSSIEAKKRIKKYGRNVLGTKKEVSLMKIFVGQFNDPLIWVLLFAVAVSSFIGHFIDAIVIGAIVIFNASFGFFQEFKAEKAIEHLRKLRQHNATVVRNGKRMTIKSEDLVPGDVIVLEEGDKIPADARIIENNSFRVEEASLTGESTPVSKSLGKLKGEKSIGDQVNMVFSGTTVVAGRGVAIVIATAHDTELGKIAKEIETIEVGETPLQKKLKEIGKILTFVVLGICVLIFMVGYLRGIELTEMFLMAISLAVAAIPEGLPAVVTITLALGLRKMLKRKALIRKLQSVETLGSVSVICSDKTGTLTKNEMTVTKIYSNEKEYGVTGNGYSLKGTINFNGKPSVKEVLSLLTIATSCNDATIEVGDPTERALMVLGAKGKIKPLDRKSEIPFSSDTKFMTVIGMDGTKYLKGAVEVILKKCKYIEINGKKRKIGKIDFKKIQNVNERFSKDALRVLAYAYGKKDLTFVGLTGMIDPPRVEVKGAIASCHKAGIRTIMITGDHLLTAQAVAKEVGILGEALEGLELNKLSDKQLRQVVKKVSVFARVSSLHKARILKALQKNGEIVAMTGDGVNDAPALKQSDVGVAMNIKGTEISKDVSDLILLDDNFVSIVAAVEEGRTIYANIKKFVKFLLAANFGEIMIVTVPIFAGFPLPILPVQILWINLVTDSFPALALGLDPADPDSMIEKPRKASESFFKGISGFMIWATIICSTVTLGLFFYLYYTSDIEYTRTMVFTTLILFELFLVFACRSIDTPFYRLKQNYYLYGAVALSLSLHFILMYTPLNVFFSLVPLSWSDWMLILPLSATGLIFFEVKKLVKPLFFKK